MINNYNKCKNCSCNNENSQNSFDVPPEYAKEFHKQVKKNIEQQKQSPKYDFSKVKGYNSKRNK